MIHVRESVVTMARSGNRMLGILSQTEGESDTGVVIAIGGPQYRVGAHRQFVQLARHMAAARIPTMRFDFVGMGDSDGQWDSFERVGPEIVTAIDALTTANPGIRKVILLGLCDAASAIMMNCNRDNRIAGLILLNPWARTEQGEAKAFMSHYYGNRLLQASFWRKVLDGELMLFKSLREFLSSLRKSLGTSTTRDEPVGSPFIDAMLCGIENFGGPALFITSEKDLTAQEFTALANLSDRWSKVFASKTMQYECLADADHTLSRANSLRTCNHIIVEWSKNYREGKCCLS